eukprot:355101-Chlamydomonas_euryale.AAC.11
MQWEKGRSLGASPFISRFTEGRCIRAQCSCSMRIYMLAFESKMSIQLVRTNLASTALVAPLLSTSRLGCGPTSALLWTDRTVLQAIAYYVTMSPSSHCCNKDAPCSNSRLGVTGCIAEGSPLDGCGVDKRSLNSV